MSCKNILRIKIIVGIILTIATSVFSQPVKIAAALKFYQGGNIDSAKICIDAASKDMETSKDYYTWYLKGFIYKDIYMKREKQNKKSPSRMEALLSFKKSLELDSKKENIKENEGNIKYIAATFRNDVASAFDSTSNSAPSAIINNNMQNAIANWDNYKKTMMIIDPHTNFNKEDIEFNLAMGSFFQNTYEKNKKSKVAYLDSAKIYFSKVLAVDPSNSKANIGMAIAFYNQGADVVNEAEYDIDLFTLDKIQDNAKKLFLQSKPYMEKAHQLNPEREDVISGLCGIYYALNEEEKSLQLKCRKY